ncbi:carboxypeptidase-like regulatory domain-containing protein [Carboxylicivirga marina]|uniref:Carboxypeptidase-like regulatory domain-containing protein n=1 Tax=Carboxylicivirga marina TaxID=2800988 RepID=A0ABS1HIV9_9BACT|nr:carboxypeptidase-like regulatory domain-containing protein [Carboxylicivirga marina]MBK3517501.1 carboxypeptidase-like regulatory domain-containing protein [Carboxylicivirga marina]
MKKSKEHFMKKMFNMRDLAKMLVALLILLYSGHVMAQDGHSISGLVTDNTGDPIPGVNVVEKGTTTVTITNMDGEYNLTLSGQNVIVSFSFIGMETKEVFFAYNN